MKASFAHLSGI